jgi:hypothetical protein
VPRPLMSNYKGFPNLSSERDPEELRSDSSIRF